MNLEMRNCNMDKSEFLNEHVMEQVERAVHRFRDRIRRITVRLTDLNGPKGGVDKRCRITAELLHSPPLVVEGESDDAYDAVAQAAARLGRVTARLIGKRRHHSHLRTALAFE